MSLMDESFPSDELFDELNNTRASKSNSLQRQYSVCHNIPTTSGSVATGNEHFQISGNNETPFLNSDCSEETCASDPVGLEHDHDRDEVKNDLGNNEGQQLGRARNSKAISYQDIHSAYTKRRYKHVTSKVAKYIAELDGKGSKGKGGQLGSNANSAGAFQRHRSMPETLTPRDDNDDRHHQQHQEESMSVANSSDTNTAHPRDESYERLMNENYFLDSRKNFLETMLRESSDKLQRQSGHNNYLQSRLYKEMDENIALRNNIDLLRNELIEYKNKQQWQQSNKCLAGTQTGTGSGPSLHSFMYYPIAASNDNTVVTTATQTDLPTHLSPLYNLSDMTAIAATATPHFNANLNDITYDSRDGSIEIPLLSVQPTTRHRDTMMTNNNNHNMMRLALNFSNDSAEVDANGNSINIIAIRSDANGNLLQPSRSSNLNGNATTNNSDSSQPSSNDSAIEIAERHEEMHSPPPLLRGETFTFRPARNWNQRKILYFDKHCNRVTDLIPLNVVHTSSSSTENAHNSNNSNQSIIFSQHTTNTFGRRLRKSFASRILRILGPCASCDDPNQTLDASNGTYMVGIPLLNENSSRV
ncbi:protein swallow [Drosophila nasuta]|uniref:protein swallow n=1 Tax=Drosophila nasuta TaxID=42062 RepID=UPI00295EAC6C|nr:protein swallow [Drosophila nasuta]